MPTADNRRGHAVLGHTDNHPWLFPGGGPGRPIGAAPLMARLHPLGIQARSAHSTVLMDLASQLPPVVLSKLLGIHIDTATQCAHQANRSGAAYAVDVVRRTTRQGP